MREGKDGAQESLQYGFVHYSTGEAATKAIEKVNGMEIAGKTVIVEEFKPKEQRNDGPRKFTNVYIKNLPTGTTKENLAEQLGKVLGDDVSTWPQGLGLDISSSYVNDQAHHYFKACWGCVDFKSPEKAEEAVKKLNDAKVKLSEDQERELEAFPFISKKQRGQALRKKFEVRRAERLQKYAGVNVYIKNLHDRSMTTACGRSLRHLAM